MNVYNGHRWVRLITKNTNKSRDTATLNYLLYAHIQFQALKKGQQNVNILKKRQCFGPLRVISFRLGTVAVRSPPAILPLTMPLSTFPTTWQGQRKHFELKLGTFWNNPLIMLVCALMCLVLLSNPVNFKVCNQFKRHALKFLNQNQRGIFQKLHSSLDIIF